MDIESELTLYLVDYVNPLRYLIEKSKQSYRQIFDELDSGKKNYLVST